MRLSKIFSNIQYGEFSKQNFGGLDNNEDISPIDYQKLLTVINRGIDAIFSDLTLKTKSVIVTTSSHIDSYTLHSDYAVSNTTSTETDRYIADTPTNPFLNDLLAIETVTGSSGIQYTLNDGGDPDSVITPEFNIIQIADPQDDQYVEVSYSASVEDIEYTEGMDAATIEVPIPTYVLDALLYYIADALSSGVTEELSLGKSNASFTRYNGEIAKIRNKNIPTQGTATRDTFHSNGWV